VQLWYHLRSELYQLRAQFKESTDLQLGFFLAFFASIRDILDVIASSLQLLIQPVISCFHILAITVW